MRLQEGRTIKSFQDIQALLASGKLAGRLGGKKFIPAWITENPDAFKDVVEATLTLLGDDPNIAGDEVIQFMLKASPTGPETWLSVISEVPDALIELSKAFAAQWFVKSADWQQYLQALQNSTEFNAQDWHNLEKDIQETFAKRAAKKGKKVSDPSNLYDTLYDDGTWKLFVPRCFEADIELASHIEPFENNGKTYNKTQWCTAADKHYYDRYTHEGKNKLYVIQYWRRGIYKDAWQIAFFRSDHIEFMNKKDVESYRKVRSAPQEMLEKIVCDNADCMFAGCNLYELWNLLGENWRKLDDIFDYRKRVAPISNLFEASGDVLINKLGVSVDLTDDAKYRLAHEESPDIVVGDKVNRISEGALSGYLRINKLTVSSSVKSIAKNAIDIYVENLQLSEGLEEIEDRAIQARSLKTLTIPASVKKIGKEAIWCPSLESLTFLGSPELSPDFCVCRELKSVDFRAPMLNIPSQAFYATDLQSLTLPEGLQTIGERAFAGLKSLEEITIPESVTYIEAAAFFGMSALKVVHLPAHKIACGDAAFANNPALVKVENMQYVEGQQVFRNCPNLDTRIFKDIKTVMESSEYSDNFITPTVKAPANAERVSVCCFRGSKVLEEFIGNENLKKIEERAFQDCQKLARVDLSACTQLRVIDAEAFSQCENLTEIVLPDVPKLIIRESAFSDCQNLTSIRLPECIRKIPENCFAKCYRLKNVNFPRRLRMIEDEAFYYTSIEKAILPSNVSTLGRRTFKNCDKLEYVELPASITVVPAECFESCSSLKSVKATDSLIKVDKEAFEYCKELTEFEVVSDDPDFDQFEDIDYDRLSFYQSPYADVLKAAGVKVSY